MSTLEETLRDELRRVAYEVEPISGLHQQLMMSAGKEGVAALKSDDPDRIHTAIINLRRIKGREHAA